MTAQNADLGRKERQLLLAAREGLHRFAALAFSDPRRGAWDMLQEPGERHFVEEAAAIVRESGAAPMELERGERPLENLDPAPSLARLPASRAEAERIHERTFGLLVSCACPPYEMEYVDGKETFQRSHTLADIGGFYRAFGLRPASRQPERPDHIALELEFYAALLRLERQADEAEGTPARDRASLCRTAQERFLREHLAWWAPTFARLLEIEDPHGFYTAAGRFVAALVPAERALLGVPAPASRAVPAVPEGAATACDGCGIAAEP